MKLIAFALLFVVAPVTFGAFASRAADEQRVPLGDEVRCVKLTATNLE